MNFHNHESEEAIKIYREFNDYSHCVNSTNFVNCDAPLDQFLNEEQNDCYCEDKSKDEFNEKIVIAIKNGDIETLRLMDVPRSYFDYACKFNNIEIIEMFISKQSFKSKLTVRTIFTLILIHYDANSSKVVFILCMNTLIS